MATFDGKIGYLELGGVDLSGFVKDVLDVEPEPWQARLLDGLQSGSITVDFRANLAAERRHYDAWWRAFERVREHWEGWRRQRLSRMHEAYHRRRR